MVTAILAAGQSKRFGSCKMLAQLKQKPILQHVIEALPQNLEKKIILGAFKDEVQELAQTLKINTLYNSNHLKGLSSSVSCAAKWALEKNEDLLLTLGDLPFVTTEDYLKLISAYSDKPLFSSFNKNSGPPTIFPVDMLSKLIHLEPDQHAKKIFKHIAHYVDIPNAQKDIDLEKDLF